jgi:hypothetical protein
MRLPIVRIIAVAFAVETLAIGILVALVAIFGPRDRAAVQAYAEHLGQFVGPIGSAILCFFGAWWVARRAPQREVLCGFALGAVCVSIDLASLYPLGGTFQWLIVVSCGGRLVAGTLGGWVARNLVTRRRASLSRRS